MISGSLRPCDKTAIAALRAVGLAAVCMAAACAAARAGSVNLALVPVGDAGNVADTLNGYGSVSYPYSMGKYDVTTAQYTTFLNAVAASGDPYGLFNAKMATDLHNNGITQTSTTAGYTYAVRGVGTIPAFDVTWGDAARFVNWLQNGQPTGPEGPATTETGTYQISGATSDAQLMAVPARSATASWVLPTVDEWYKSAYYKSGGTNAGYWAFATQSNWDNVPTNVLDPTGTNNANYEMGISVPPYVTRTDDINWLTPVGSFAASPSAYGTYDQSGDVWQWEETAVNGLYREYSGGSWADVAWSMSSSGYGYPLPAAYGSGLGFRVANITSSVPEPATAMTLLSAVATVLSFHRCRRFFRKRECSHAVHIRVVGEAAEYLGLAIRQAPVL